MLLDLFSFFLTVVFIFSAGFDTPYMACWTATKPVQQLEQIQKLRLIMNYDESMKKRRWSHHKCQINRYFFRISDVSWYLFSRHVGCQPKLDGEFQIIIDLSDIHHGFTLFYDEMMMGLSWFMIISNHIMYSFSIYSGFYHVLESSLIFQCVFLIHHGLICQDGSWTFWTVWTSGTLNFYPIDLEKFGSVLVTVTVDQE